MGRTTYAVGVLMALLVVIAARISPDLLLWLAGLAAVVFLIYFGGVLWFAQRNPGVALLEGG